LVFTGVSDRFADARSFSGKRRALEMESEEILHQLQSIKKKIQQLSRKTDSLISSHSVETILRMRGLRVFRKNPEDRLFFLPTLSPVRQTRFYEMMKRYSFRLVLRDMIKHPNGFGVTDLTHYCTADVARDYCDRLYRMGILKRKQTGHYQVQALPLSSFGSTLEWFVAQMFKREFSSPSLYGVTLKKTDSGGDYDVIASWNRRLVYVEVKSSPPRGIEQSEIFTFFSRIDELLPEVAILFNDTQLRMKDKLVVMFEEELKRRYGRKSKALYPVIRLVDELFHVRNRIFIINSRKDIFENFSLCLRHYLRYANEGEVDRVKG
jgi:hypothetical protein